MDLALHRLVKRKTLRRLARGLYECPRKHAELGLLSPDIEKVAKALAGKDRIRLQPAGAYATNLLGLSEQVPAKVVFLTDGPSRTVKIGRQEIQLRRTTPRNMATAGRLSGLLEEKSSIPMVHEQMPLIQDLQTDEWWQDVTVPMLENVRRRLRALVKLIEKQQRKPIYTDFEDEIGAETAIQLPGFASPDSYERFRAKTRQFLREHENDLVIHKLRMNEPLTATDLQELERMLTASGLAKPEHLAKAKTENNGLGLFVRSLVGLDREAAKRALAGFGAGKTLSANQIEFVNLIIEHLTEHGVMDAGLLYESPFTDLNPQGPEGVFNSSQIDELVAVLTSVHRCAAGV